MKDQPVQPGPASVVAAFGVAVVVLVCGTVVAAALAALWWRVFRELV